MASSIEAMQVSPGQAAICASMISDISSQTDRAAVVCASQEHPTRFGLVRSLNSLIVRIRSVLFLTSKTWSWFALAEWLLAGWHLAVAPDCDSEITLATSCHRSYSHERNSLSATRQMVNSVRKRNPNSPGPVLVQSWFSHGSVMVQSWPVTTNQSDSGNQILWQWQQINLPLCDWPNGNQTAMLFINMATIYFSRSWTCRKSCKAHGPFQRPYQGLQLLCNCFAAGLLLPCQYQGRQGLHWDCRD